MSNFKIINKNETSKTLEVQVFEPNLLLGRTSFSVNLLFGSTVQAAGMKRSHMSHSLHSLNAARPLGDTYNIYIMWYIVYNIYICTYCLFAFFVRAPGTRAPRTCCNTCNRFERPKAMCCARGLVVAPPNLPPQCHVSDIPNWRASEWIKASNWINSVNGTFRWANK